MPDLGLFGGTSGGGYLSPISPNASREEMLSVLNDIINRLNGQLKTQIFSDGTTKRMLFGYKPNGWGTGKDFGIKISKPGIDVTSAADEDLLFNMSLETWQWNDTSTTANIKLGAVDSDAYGFQFNDGSYDRFFVGRKAGRF